MKKIILAAATVMMLLTSGNSFAQKASSYLTASIGANVTFTHVYLAKIMGTDLWVEKDEIDPVQYATVVKGDQKFVVFY